jgi:hypothetical protein
VLLVDMADHLVKGMGAFLRLAEMNPYDEGTTLDLVEFTGGHRRWWAGKEAVARMRALQREHQQGCSVLEQLSRALRTAATQDKRTRRYLNAAVLEVVQDGLPEGFRIPCDVDELRRADVLEALPCADGLASTPLGELVEDELPVMVRSLRAIHGFDQSLDEDLADADAHEESLKRASVDALDRVMR